MGFITPGFDFFDMQSPYLELAAALIGVCVGSFLNVLALRSLSGESLTSPWSKCPKCQHRLGIFELVPIVSYIFQAGRCRHCKEKISWHYPLVEAATAGLFAAIVHHFAQATFEASPERVITTIAMLFFVSVLVAVTVTDFREKLIPHEITYPSIILGLIYSFAVRHDLIGALAGVGFSYILFDFIAFYGLKYYVWTHPELAEEAQKDETATSGINATELAATVLAATVLNASESNASESNASELNATAQDEFDYEEIDDEIDRSLGILRAPAKTESVAADADEDDEPFEVMGGGDAVLSAVLAAWLGWEKLAVALVIGFMVGAIMGAFYLIHELIKQKRIAQVRKPAMLGFLVAGAIIVLPVTFAAITFHMTELLYNASVWFVALVVALGGTTFGVIWSGNSIAKPFPFGPALAFGGIYAIFLISLADHTYIK
jgi:leader peptidase (prepilin peptidase)/N-methyltransferase